MIRERQQELREDERGVSPVLGVALLIAITVTLVAVIGVVVLGVGPTNTGAPQANLVFENNSSAVVMSHQGGDKLVNSSLTIQVQGTANATSLPSEMTAGDSTVVADGTVAEGDVVKIVWEASNSDKSQVIASYEVG